MLGLGWPELMIIALVGFFVFGPERLPTLARDAARMITQLRAMADGASAELRAQLPSAAEFGLDEVRSLRDLHPRTLVSRALFDSDEMPDLLGDGPATPTPTPARTVTVGGGGGALAGPTTAAAGSVKDSYARSAVRAPGTPPPYDLDAT
jgi:sec-independent protein translocase protein TatB